MGLEIWRFGGKLRLALPDFLTFDVEKKGRDGPPAKTPVSRGDWRCDAKGERGEGTFRGIRVRQIAAKSRDKRSALHS